jgi:hypothetical protein
LNLRTAVLRAFDDRIQAAITNAIGSGGRRSWCLDYSRRNSAMWPGLTWRFRQLTRRFNSADYEM